MEDFNSKWRNRLSFHQKDDIEIYNIWNDKKLYTKLIEDFLSIIPEEGYDLIATVESGGFIFASPIAYRLEKGLLTIRKIHEKNISADPICTNTFMNCKNEQEVLCIDSDMINIKNNYLIIDDLCKSLETLKCVLDMVEVNGNKVSYIAVIANLSGADNLKGIPIYSIIN